MKPLGLPAGSVRAILAILLVTAAIALAFIGLVDGKEIVTLAAVAVTFYFATRQPVNGA